MLCTRCGKTLVPGDATVCSSCAPASSATGAAAGAAAGDGAPPPVPSPDDFMGRMIPTGNKPSLVGYYAAFAAWLPFLGPIARVVAIVYGVKGVRLARRHPEVRGGCHAWFGIVGGIGLGLLGIAWTIGMIAVLRNLH